MLFRSNIYVVFTTPDGCMEVVDNATIRCSIITDPTDVCRFGWAAFCTEILGAPVQCTNGISRVVLQYLGTSDQVVSAWATANNYPVRVVMEDGQPKPATKDFIENRINLVVEKGVATGSEADALLSVLAGVQL